MKSLRSRIDKLLLAAGNPAERCPKCHLSVPDKLPANVFGWGGPAVIILAGTGAIKNRLCRCGRPMPINQNPGPAYYAPCKHPKVYTGIDFESI